MMTFSAQKASASTGSVDVKEVAAAAQVLYQMDFGEGANLAHAGRKVADEYMVAAYELIAD